MVGGMARRKTSSPAGDTLFAAPIVTRTLA